MDKSGHNTGFHNLVAPKEIVPVILNILKPNSIIDIGCGLGTFMKVFKDHGVPEVFGIDGPWCNKELLFKNIESHEFEVKDLEKNLGVNKKFDLAICLEVAEHLKPQRAQSFIEELTNMSNIILFSAAIPKQGGDHHYNEQWLSYWVNLFEKYDFKLYDILRCHFWENDNIYWWYKQNMVLFIKNGSEPEGIKNFPKKPIFNLVHPDLFLLVNNFKDKNAIKRYLKLLYKAIMFKLGIIK